jgi:hypothetical protein
VTLTGCVEADRDPNRVTYVTNTGFDTSLSYPIFGVVDIGLGYYNETLGLAPDGTRRDIFYSPDAQFYLDIVANLDVIYEKASGRGEKATAAAPAPSPVAGSGAVASAGPSF